MRRFACLITLVATIVSQALSAGEDTQKAHLALLTAAGLKTDGPALIEFFRSRTLSPGEREKLEQLVNQLGAETFAERNKAQEALIAAGRKAVPLLTPALKDANPEIVRRARSALKTIDAVPETELVRAVAGLLTIRKPKGAAEALLAYLPYLDEERAEEDLFQTLQALSATGEAEGKVVRNALVAASHRQRMAAVWVLGRSKEKADRDRVVPLLADKDDRVRYRAAEALIVGKDGRGVAGLIGLLEKGVFEQAALAEELLGMLAGEKAPLVGLEDSNEQRRKCHAAWRAWWRDHESKLDLSNVDLFNATLGYRLVVANGGYGGAGAVWEYGSDRKARWQMNRVGGPFDARVLPGGKILIAEYSDRRVSERDRSGKVLWEYRPPNAPLEVQRLPGGNTLITTNYEILEVTREGKVVFTHRDGSGNIFSGQKLPNGHILYGLYSGWVIEIDSKGKEVLKFGIERPRGLANIVVLPRGRYLLPLAGSNRIVEMDRTGKVTREVPVPGPTSVALLLGGNLLVGSHTLNNVREVDRKGSVVWEHKAEGQIFRVRVR